MDLSESHSGPQFQEYSVDDALYVFENRDDPGRPLTADDITSALGWSRRTAHNKLSELVEEDKLRTRKVGARARVWWVPLDSDSTIQSIESNKVTNTNSPPSEDEFTSTSPTGEFPSTAEEVLESIRDDLPARSEEERLERSEAILTAYEFLQEHGDESFGQADIDEIKEQTFAAHPTESDREKLWYNYLREGLRALPGVESAGGTASLWYFLPSSHPVAEELDSTHIDAQVAEIDVKGEGKAADRCRAMIQLAYDHLRNKGYATKDDLERILPDYYAHYAHFDIFWSYILRDELKQLDNVVAPPRGAGKWQYISPELDRELNVEIDEWILERDVGVRGTGEVAKRQRQILQLAYDYLEREKEAVRSDFEKELPDYTVHYSGFDGLWGYFLQEALEKSPNIETRKEQGDHGGTLYEYVGD